jgi:hypothetical protein
MLTYASLKTNARQLVALTSVQPIEFEFLLRAFAPRSEAFFRYRTWEGKFRRQPRYQPQVEEKLADPAEQLFFVLVFLKNHPLQEFQAALFDLSQGSVSGRVRLLLGLLNEALKGLGLSPCQDSDTLQAQLDRLHIDTLNLEATEREVPRSTDQDAQRQEYSGKVKTHTAKNQVLCDEDGYVHFLSLTHEGITHDKALAEAEALDFPVGLLLRQDTGYQGYQPAGVVVSQPQKKPRQGTLTEEQKARNQAISSKRVVVEHAINGIKRLHCLSQRLRLRGWAIRDQLMRVGTGLHNLRVTSPCRRYHPRTPTWALVSQL